MTDISRENRFSDVGRGAGLLGGLRSSTDLPDTFTAKDTKRNLQPFKKFGVPNMQKFAKKSDTQIENIAANAIVRRGIKRGAIKRHKLRTTVNTKQFGAGQVKWAKNVMAQDSPRAKALRRTRAARQHIKLVRRNRIAMKFPLFSKNV